MKNQPRFTQGWPCIISDEPRLAVAILRQVAKRLRQSEHPLVG